jgi:hypothetical protein
MDSDEEFAVELQKQFLGESSSQGPFETSISSNFVNQTVAINDASGSHGIIGPHVYCTITEVVQALEKSVNKEEQFFITLRRRTPLSHVLKLWRYEAKKQDVQHQFRIKFLEEDGIDSGALAREFFTDVVPAIGEVLFPNGTPLDSTYHVQNGNFRACGEIVASSLANGGPPPCFMDEKAFQNLVHLEMNALDTDAENCMTATEKEIIDNVKSDVNLHRDSVLEHGYTGPVDAAHMDDIVRSMKVSLVNKRALYLREFKAGLSLFGLSTILDAYPCVCKPLFVQNQLEKVDATYLFSLMQPVFSPVGSSRRQLEENLMDNFQDLLMALDSGEISGYTSPLLCNDNESQGAEAAGADEESIAMKYDSADLSSAGVMKWLTGQKHRQLNGQKIKIQAKFDHECLTRNPAHSLCFPLVGACGREITFPVSHMKDYETFKDVFLLGFCNGQEFAKP